MKRFFQKIGSLARRLVNFAVRVLLEVFYYVFLLPVGLLIRARADFLDVRGDGPGWVPRPEIKDAQTYLHRQ